MKRIIRNAYTSGRLTAYLYLAVFIIVTTGMIFVFPESLSASGATTTLHIVKYSSDGKTVMAEKTVDYQWMESNLPVLGDGTTHYYHQGPVFEGDVWDPSETVNLKDKGAVKGTAVRDLCDLVGGMEAGGEVVIKAVDGFAVTLAYSNIYDPLDIQGTVALCWYKAPDADNAKTGEFGYPADDEFNSAIKIVIMAGTANQQGQYVFGNNDMKICMPEEKYQHFYSGLPSTNGLSGKWISEIRIYSTTPPPQQTGEVIPYETQTEAPWRSIGFGAAGLVLVLTGAGIAIRKNS
ncbi:MAG: hypothetical protein JXA46_18595 [Dehalococcoidales bacterium]|nr:hypothetical protein [Dehalococcoidales bacterium]